MDMNDERLRVQHQIFEDLIDPVWSNYDTENKGYITQDECKEFAQQTLDDAGLAATWNEDLY